jgi:uncharacterized protein (DUF362 family)
MRDHDMIHGRRFDTRRGFISRSLAAGAGAGAVFASGCAARQVERTAYVGGSGKSRHVGNRSRVVIGQSHDRREAAYHSLLPLKDEVAAAIGNRRVVVKINAGVPVEGTRKCSTYPDQLRGILDFLREFHDREIIVAEGVAGQAVSAFTGFELYGLLPLEKEYEGVRFVDANDTPYSAKYIRSWQNQPIPINIINMYFDPTVFLISAARMKTHNAVVATLSLKNVVMGAPICHYRNTGIPQFQRNEKARMHGNRGSWDNVGEELSYNLVRIALEGVQPDLSVIDGVTAIEGNGPWGGEVVDHGVSIAGTDFVAADRVGIELMGIDPAYLKYLEWCGAAGMGNWDMGRIDVEGARIRDIAREYRLHEDIATQIKWMDGRYEL